MRCVLQTVLSFPVDPDTKIIGRRFGADMLAAPAVDRFDNLLELGSGGREFVNSARRHNRLDLFVHQAAHFELVKPLLQRSRVTAAAGAAKLVEAPRPFEKSTYD